MILKTCIIIFSSLLLDSCNSSGEIHLSEMDAELPAFKYQDFKVKDAEGEILDPDKFYIDCDCEFKYLTRDSAFHIVFFEPGTFTVNFTDTLTAEVMGKHTFSVLENPLIKPEWDSLSAGKIPRGGLLTVEQAKVYELYRSQLIRNEPFPEFAFSTDHGDELTHKDLQGKVTVAFFWIFNCPHCKTPMPDLNSLKREFDQNKEVAVISFYKDSLRVSDMGDTEYYNPKIKDYSALPNPFEFTQLGNTAPVFDQLMIKGYPVTLIVDRKGVIRSVIMGSMMNGGVRSTLKQELNRLL